MVRPTSNITATNDNVIAWVWSEESVRFRKFRAELIFPSGALPCKPAAERAPSRPIATTPRRSRMPRLIWTNVIAIIFFRSDLGSVRIDLPTALFLKRSTNLFMSFQTRFSNIFHTPHFIK
jgi:hypothetical protein